MGPESTLKQLDERLIEFAAIVAEFSELLNSDRKIGRHVESQLLRSGSAPMAIHGEASSAESRKDFIHKMKQALKELRETERWLKLSRRLNLCADESLCHALLDENDQLIRIFAVSIRTARENDRQAR
jgi:four helix bundle protein